MKLWILSDMHLGMHSGRVSLEPPDHDILICAGDVRGDIPDAIDALETITGETAILVAGNHEFYGFEGATLETEYRRGRHAAQESRVILLENKVAIVDGVRFLGCTLWTDYKLFGGETIDAAMDAARRGLNDHRLIKMGGRGKAPVRFDPVDALDHHKASRRWLAAMLASPHDGPSVVVTHHGPHRGSVAPQFANDLLSAAFVLHMPELVEGPNAPILWIHGHTHVACDYQAGPCRVICNPMGYPHEYTGAPLDLVVEL